MSKTIKDAQRAEYLQTIDDTNNRCFKAIEQIENKRKEALAIAFLIYEKSIK